ncbi:MAG: ketoacyl-ACP synthase III [Candidatus Fimivivens sp.]|nr:ketoacyl-ACP synthase III [Candidatus Fimivivens sp.]
MITSSFNNILIKGIASAVPTKKLINKDYSPLFGEETVTKLISSTGVQESFHVHEKQTASDLAFAAAKHLLDTKKIDLESIGILVFIGTYTDYIVPATAFVLQKRLGLSTNCIVYDINLACSSIIYGMHTVSSLLTCSSAERALLLVGDTTSKTISESDTSRLLFGDGGAAILLEKSTDVAPIINFGVKSDGARFKAIIIPGGGFRNPELTKDPVKWADGNIRSDYNLYMNGTDVFSFTMTDVPALFKEFMDHFNVTNDDFDALVMHQPNQFILKHLAKKIKVPWDKVPISLDRYGNTSGASIPMTLCDAYGNESGKRHKLMASGFGVGLSWGVATFEIDTDDILPIIHTDDYYNDGGVSHD